ncbi:MAG: hypothetical protein B6241_06000 [Spirochaetaceae bacterium 4572_59]|nr:MAG: hypothetical protein B6241_06000 [Spirochaetaceae bacterium 4572_59]
MFYIFFKLDNKKQLFDLYSDRMKEILFRIESLLNEAGGSRFSGEEDIFQFAALYKETALNVLDCAVRMKAFLDENEEHLFGYTIILSADHDNEDRSIHFHNLSLLAEEENNIWLEGSAVSRYSAFIERSDEEKGETLVPIQIKSEKMLFVEDLYRNFLLRPELVPSIKNELNEWLYRDNEPNGLFIRSQDPDEALLILKDVLEDDRALMEQYLTIEPASESWDPLIPLLTFINDAFLGQVGQYLSSEDRSSWTLDGPFLQKVCHSDWYLQCSDQFFQEFSKALSLYWSACLRKLDTYPTPPVLILREPELFSPESLILVRDIFLIFIENHPGQKFLLLSKEEKPPELFENEKMKSMLIRQAKGEMACQKVHEAFSELSITKDEIKKVYNHCGHSLSSLFFHFWNISEKRLSFGADSPEWVFLQNQDLVSLEILYLCLNGRYFITRKIILAYFETRNIPVPEIEERLKRLENLSFLRFFSGSWGLNGRPATLEFLNQFQDLEKIELNNEFSRFLERQYEEEGIHSLSGLFYYLNLAGDIDFGQAVLNRIINHLLDLRQISLAEALLNSSLFPDRKLSTGQQEGLHNILFAGRLRSTLLKRNRKELIARQNSGYLSLMESTGLYSEEFLLQQAHYHAVNGDSEAAMNMVKKSLFAFQKNSDHSGETKTNIALALMLLAQRKMQASVDYFEIAMRIGEQLEDRISSLFGGRFMVLASYLFGNLSMALRLLETQIVLVEKERNRETQIFLLFLKGRIFFELGRYSESFKILKKARGLGKSYNMRVQMKVISAWMARALCFGHSEKLALNMLNKQPESLETAYFKAEALYVGGDPVKGAEVLKGAIANYDKSREFIHEMNCWEDGYRLIEGHLSDNNFYEDVLFDQALGFYFFLLGKSGRKQEALEGLKPLCRMDAAYNQQPFGYYFFFYAQDLMQEDETIKDENYMIFLSHSFKLLQTRAGRFDNQQMKHSYFRKNFWNNEIVKKAQEMNFI